jgi:hypothetical protein
MILRDFEQRYCYGCHDVLGDDFVKKRERKGTRRVESEVKM